MIVTKFKNIQLSIKVIEYFDKLAKFASNDNYKQGESEFEIKEKNKLGRYSLSAENIYRLDIGVDLNYLIYSREGHIRQDELILIYFSQVLFLQMKSDIEENSGKFIYIDKKSYKLTQSNILAIVHLLSYDDLKKVLNNSLKNEEKYKLVDILEQFSEYDLESITGYKDKKNEDIVVVDSILNKKDNISKEKTKDLENIEKVNKYEGFDKFLKEIMNKFPELIKSIMYIKSNKLDKIESLKEEILENKDIKNIDINKYDDILKNIDLNNSKFDKNDINKIFLELDNLKNKIKKSDKNIEKLSLMINNKNNKKSQNFTLEKNDESYAVLEKNDEILENINYNKNNDYIEKTTGKKIKENKKEVEDIMYEYDKSTKDKKGNGNILKQNNFSEFRNKSKKDLDILDFILYILNNPTYSKTSLETLELSLKNISARYIKKTYISEAFEKVTFSFVNKGLSYIDKKIEETFNIKMPKLSNEYHNKFEGISDIDDIKIDVGNVEIKKIYANIAYKILQKIIDDKLLDESFKKNDENIYKYPKSRRLLDNILIEFIKKITNTKDDFDFINDKEKNILRNAILNEYEKQKGFKYIHYKELSEMKDIDITTWILYLMFNNTNFNRSNLKYISSFLTKNNLLSFENYLVDKSRYSKNKREIQKKLKTEIQMKEFCKYNNIVPIYLFYLDIYKIFNQENRINNIYVCEGAKIVCSFGVGVSKLIVENSKEYINGLKKASINDKNITPFSSCSVCKICKPAIIGSWQNSLTNEYSNSQKSLMKNAISNCAVGGILKIIDPNQNLKYNSPINREKNEKTNKIDIKNNKNNNEVRCIWIDKAYNEYLNYQGRKESSNLLAKNGDMPLKRKISIYHSIGGGIIGSYKISWCMSFVNYIMNKSIDFKLKTASTDIFSKIYKNNYIKLKNIYYGAIVHFKQYTKNGKYTNQGHICFIVGKSQDGKNIFCLGGNQNNEIKISKYNIDKQYLKNNNYMKLDGIYWPKGIQIENNHKLTFEDIMDIEGEIENV